MCSERREATTNNICNYLMISLTVVYILCDSLTIASYTHVRIPQLPPPPPPGGQCVGVWPSSIWGWADGGRVLWVSVDPSQWVLSSSCVPSHPLLHAPLWHGHVQQPPRSQLGEGGAAACGYPGESPLFLSFQVIIYALSLVADG